MAEITGYTATRMDEILATTIVSGTIDGAGDLILTMRSGATINAGSVIGVTVTEAGVRGAGGVIGTGTTDIVKVTQAQYDAITNKDPATLYVISG